MLSFKEISQLIKKSQKQLAYLVVSILLLVFSIALESANPSFKVQKPVTVFSVPSVSQNSLQIKYDFNTPFESFKLNNQKAPKVIQTVSNSAAFTVFNSSYFALDQNSVLNTLIFTKDRYHAILNEGQLIFDTRTELKKTTIQIGNALIDPYPNGIFFVSKLDNQLQIQVLSGNAQIGVYSSDGNLKRSFLLTKYSQISAFDAFAEEGDMQIEKPVKTNELYQDFLAKNLVPSISEIINTKNVFTLNYKGQEVKPQTLNRLSDFYAMLSFNNNKKNYYTFLPFYIELNNIVNKSESNLVSPSDIANLKQVYLTQIANNTQSIQQFRQLLAQKSPFVLAITPADNLYELKVYLEEFLSGVSPSQRILSELEDLYYLYPEADFIAISESLERIRSIAPSIGKDDALNILAILDNLAETTIQANSQELFSTRNLVAEKLTNTIEKSQFNTKSRQHLARLQNAYRQNQLTTAQIRTSVETLLTSLDPSSQQTYRDFLLELN